jgi:RhoGEF, Guanine nucleotide exchange factor for Rho/Rac/Cdc42-like GTPases
MRNFNVQRRQLSGADLEPMRYDLPRRVRNQIILLWDDALGKRVEMFYNPWKKLYDHFEREFGIRDPHIDPREEFDLAPERCRELFLEAETAHALYMVEVTFRAVLRQSPQARHELGVRLDAAQAIERLNRYLREARIGYQFTEGILVRLDSEHLYAETVAPVLHLLTAPEFGGANDEYRQAHARFSAGDYKGAVTAAANAVESTMKVICDQRNWAYEPTVQAGSLIDILFDRGLIPDHLNDNRQGFRSLVAGVSVVRNKSASAHGAGATPVDVPPQMASYVLHVAASTILYLVEQHKATP